MDWQPSQPSCLLLGLGLFCAALPGFCQTGFWNAKEPSAYSDEEKTRILTDSPWSKVVRPKRLDESPRPTGYFGPSGGGDRDFHPSRRGTSSRASTSRKEDLKNWLAFYGPILFVGRAPN